jgi:hypothetical protein
MAGFKLLLKLLTGAAGGGMGSGDGMASGLGRLAAGGASKGVLGSAARGLGGGNGGGKGKSRGGGMGSGKSGDKGEGRGRCGCGKKGESSEHLAKIVELVALRLAERNAKPLAQTTWHAPLPQGDGTAEAPALPPPDRVIADNWPQPNEAAPTTIEVRAVTMAAYACRMCGRRISVAADDPIADPRCPQCGGPMDTAPQA